MITYLKLLFAAFFWGGTFIAGRIVSRSIDPYSAAFVRFTIASIFLLLFIRMQEGKFPRLSWKQLGFMVCLGDERGICI